MDKILEKMRNTRLLAGIGVACLILGTMLSYVSYNIWGYSYQISLFDYWEGKIVLLIAIANLLFIFKDFIEKWVPSVFKSGFGKKIAEIDNPKASLVPTIAAAAFALWLTLRLEVSFSNYSLGFYSLWLGVIALVAYAFLHRNTEA